jgi:PKD repeat protein
MNATHTFTDPGVYDVTLTVTDKAGSNSMKKPNYITVTA